MHRYPSGTELELEYSCSILQIVYNCSNPRTFFLIKVKNEITIHVLPFKKCVYRSLAAGNRSHYSYFEQENCCSPNRKVGCGLVL